MRGWSLWHSVSRVAVSTAADTAAAFHGSFNHKQTHELDHHHHSILAIIGVAITSASPSSGRSPHLQQPLEKTQSKQNHRGRHRGWRRCARHLRDRGRGRVEPCRRQLTCFLTPFFTIDTTWSTGDQRNISSYLLTFVSRHSTVIGVYLFAMGVNIETALCRLVARRFYPRRISDRALRRLLRGGSLRLVCPCQFVPRSALRDRVLIKRWSFGEFVLYILKGRLR